MRVNCPHCDSKAVITSSNRFSNTVKELYCSCLNTQDCGATFVFSLAYKHDLNPPRKTTLQIASALLGHLSEEDKRAVQRDVFN